MTTAEPKPGKYEYGSRVSAEDNSQNYHPAKIIKLVQPVCEVQKLLALSTHPS